MPAPVPWHGEVIAVQPHVQLTRSFDERSESHVGYVLRLSGQVGQAQREFLVSVKEEDQQEYDFRVGDQNSG